MQLCCSAILYYKPAGHFFQDNINLNTQDDARHVLGSFVSVALSEMMKFSSDDGFAHTSFLHLSFVCLLFCILHLHISNAEISVFGSSKFEVKTSIFS